MSYYFGTGAVAGKSANNDVPVYEGFVAPTGDALMQIATEGVLEGAQLQAALHIADATIAYTAVHESASAAEAVLESVIGSTIGKIKEGLKKLWSKIKAWFASIRKSVSMMFTKGKDFVTTYKKEIESKPTRGFEYEGHVWSIDAGTKAFDAGTKALQESIEDVVGKLEGSIEDFSARAMQAQSTDGAKGEYATDELHESILRDLASRIGASANSDMSDLKEALSKKFRSGEDDKQELKEFAKVTRGTLIDIIKDIDKNLKVVTDNEKLVNKTFTTALKALDKAEIAVGKKENSSFDGDDATAKASSRAKVTTLASKMGAAVRYGQAVNSSLASTAVDSIKAAATEAESVLKSFIRFKGVKEGYQTNLETGTDDVMESLIARVGF